MANDGPLIDQYAGLNHKLGMDPREPGGFDAAPAYLPDQSKRRRNAYARLAAYLEAVAREFLREDPNDPERVGGWREFGDAGALVDTVAASVLGSGGGFQIVGADAPLPDAPDIPAAPPEPTEDQLAGRSDTEQAIMRTVFERAIEIWEQNATAILEQWLADTELRPALQTAQERLDAWVEADQVWSKIVENERENVVPLGDGVIEISWDPDAGRPTLDIWEPDAYEPVLATGSRSRYPGKVHLVWEFDETNDAGETERWVRRRTYELIPVADLEGMTWPPAKYLREGQTQTHVCVLSDGRALLDEFETLEGPRLQWETITIEGEEIELDQWPTGLDFIPLVHVTHDLAGLRHFGRSLLSRLAQLLDEVAAADTDESISAAWGARPPVAVSGLGPAKADGTGASIAVRPGSGWRLADGGEVSTVEMAKALPELGARISRLLKRLAVNSRVPEGIQGRVDASEVPSGFALTLSFTSFESMIEDARLARQAKYALVGKFYQRVAIQNDDESLAGSTEVYPVEIRWGSFMPQDLAGTATTLAALRTAGLLSQETGILEAQAAGLKIDDPAAELAAIRAGMAETAEMIAVATGSQELAAEFLGYSAADLTGRESQAPPPAVGLGAAGFPDPAAT